VKLAADPDRLASSQIDSGESASLQILVSVAIKWQLPAVVHVVAKIDMIRRFEREPHRCLPTLFSGITIVVRAEIAWCADDHVNQFTTKLEPVRGTR